MHVRELMSNGVTTIGAGASCQEAVERMFQGKVRHLPVIEADGRMVGIVTDRDLRHQLFARGTFEHGERHVDELLRTIPIREVMSSPVISVGPEEPLEAAARLMREDKIGSLPVVEDGRPVGIITETDLLRQICRADKCSPDVEYIVVSWP
jgi:acetoin utilization protein AcuB